MVLRPTAAWADANTSVRPAGRRIPSDRKVKLSLTAALVCLAGLVRAGDSPRLDVDQADWWLAKNLRVVTYEFLERRHRSTDLSCQELLALVDRLGGCDVVLLKGFHYWRGRFDDSSWGYPRFRALAESLIPKLRARGIKAGVFGFTDRHRSYHDGPDHQRVLGVWKEYVRLGAELLFVDEESGHGGLDIPASCLAHCAELKKTFGLPVGLFLYGPASASNRVAEMARHVDVIGEMGYNLFLEARGDYGLQEVTRHWSKAAKTNPKHPVAYWTGALVVEQPGQGPGSVFWRQRFGDRTLAAYFEAYYRTALEAGADGVFFHSLCRWAGLPADVQAQVAEAVRRQFNARSRR